MKPSDFAGWLAALSSLSAAQRRIVFRELALAEADDPCEEGVEICEPRSAADAMRAEERSDAVAATLSASGERDIFREIATERYSRTGCPRCGALMSGPGVRREVTALSLRGMSKTFNPFTGTPVAGWHKDGRSGASPIEGESLAKAAERCQIHPSTAFRWRHRFLAALNLDKPKSLSGIVEADETFILESLKGSAGRPRQARAPPRRQSRQARPLGRADCRRGSRPQRRMFDAVLSRLERRRQPKRSVRRTNRLQRISAHGGSAITAFAKRAKLKVHVLPCARQPQARQLQFHINNVNAYHGRLKSGCATLPRRRHRILSTYPKLAPNPRSHACRRWLGSWIAAAAGLGPNHKTIRAIHSR